MFDWHHVACGHCGGALYQVLIARPSDWASRHVWERHQDVSATTTTMTTTTTSTMMMMMSVRSRTASSAVLLLLVVSVASLHRSRDKSAITRYRERAHDNSQVRVNTTFTAFDVRWVYESLLRPTTVVVIVTFIFSICHHHYGIFVRKHSQTGMVLSYTRGETL